MNESSLGSKVLNGKPIEIDAELAALLPIESDHGGGIRTCDARRLHEFLKVGKVFAAWIKERIEAYSFIEGVDYVTEHVGPLSGSGNRGARIEYHLSVGMAKELSMVERNEQGKRARQYFIACEENPMQALNNPKRLRGLLANYAERVEVLEEHVAILEPKAAVYDQIAVSRDELNITRVAKLIDASPHDLFKWMRERKWLYRSDGNTPHQDKINAGLMRLKIGPIQSGPNKGRQVSQPVVTGKGILQLAREYHAERPQVLFDLLPRIEKEIKLLAGSK